MKLEIRKFSKLKVHIMLNVRSKGSQKNITQAKQNCLEVTDIVFNDSEAESADAEQTSVEKTM